LMQLRCKAGGLTAKELVRIADAVRKSMGYRAI